MTFHSFESGGFATRRLRYALIASLLLHLLLLWPSTPKTLPNSTPGLLHAALRATQPLPLPKPLPHATTPVPAPALAPKKPESKILEQPSVTSVPQMPAPAAEKLAPPSSSSPMSPPASVAVSAPMPARPGVVAVMEQAGASGEALDGLRGYLLAVASQARRFKRYPPQAMASGWAGSVEVRLEVGSDGRPRATTVTRSSGHELLDGAAVAMIDAGAQRARLPESLRGKAFAVILPVVFNLEDE